MRQYLIMVTLGDESKSPHVCIDTRHTTHAKNDFFTRKFQGYVFKIGQTLCIQKVSTHNTQPSRTQNSYQNTFVFFISNTLNSLPSLFFFLSLCNKSIHNCITRIPNYYITNH